jgi:PREDICTED: similar to ras related v-ral simian leukemia viral oncogene homolog A isoform 3
MPRLKKRRNEVSPGIEQGHGSNKSEQIQAPILRVIMVGSGGVGKSALTLQFMYDEVSVLFLYFVAFFRKKSLFFCEKKKSYL